MNLFRSVFQAANRLYLGGNGAAHCIAHKRIFRNDSIQFQSLVLIVYEIVNAVLDQLVISPL